MRGLDGKIGIIAGAARGIGAATAARLAQEGVKLVLGDILEEEVNQTAKNLRSDGHDVVAQLLDGTNKASQNQIVQFALKKYGRLDFYHSNLAGGTVGDTDAMTIEEEVLDLSFAINTKSHLLATQAALPEILKNGGGSLIYTSSGSASGAEPMRPAYAMHKNAVHALARHVASKWGRKGIRANVICPGLIMTEAVAIYMDDKQIDYIKRITPSDRLGQPEDIAATVAFLASEDGRFVNGQAWHVNGGTQMRD